MSWDDDLNSIMMQLDELRGLPKLTLRRAEKKIEAEIVQEFMDGVDPYGDRWAPLAPSTRARGRTGPPLTNDGDMLESLDITAKGDELTCSMDSPFPFHQAGTARMPARTIFPDGRGLPVSWEKAITDSVDEELETYELFSEAS